MTLVKSNEYFSPFSRTVTHPGLPGPSSSCVSSAAEADDAGGGG